MKKLIRIIMLLVIVATIILTGKLYITGRFSASTVLNFTNTSDILLVNDTHPLSDDYIPGELVNLYEQKRHFLLASSDIYLEREAFEAANRMFLQAEKEDMNGFIVTSGYRTREQQAEIYASQQDGTAQEPGHSEHETGLAFDVTTQRDGGGFETTAHYAWLIENCWDFGFILRYPEGKEHITGIAYEPWHYRYVGVDAALEIRDSGLTLEEYLMSVSESADSD